MVWFVVCVSTWTITRTQDPELVRCGSSCCDSFMDSFRAVLVKSVCVCACASVLECLSRLSCLSCLFCLFCLSVCLSVCLSTVCLSVCVNVCLCECVSVRLWVFVGVAGPRFGVSVGRWAGVHDTKDKFGVWIGFCGKMFSDLQQNPEPTEDCDRRSSVWWAKSSRAATCCNLVEFYQRFRQTPCPS